MSDHDAQSPIGPLHGIRILDLTRLYPGPLATLLLAEMGAEVIKIEDPRNPDPMRQYPPFQGNEAAGHLAVNRSKKNFALRIEDPKGAAIFLQMVAQSDVVLEQFRPGYLDRIGCGYAAAHARNDQIIYVSLTGYGQTGPYRDHAGHDLNFQAISGLLSITGSPETGPAAPGAQIADTAGGAYMAVIACLSALLARLNRRTGQHVDVSMVDGCLPLISLQMAHYWAIGQAPGFGQGFLSGLLPCYGTYSCRDGRHVALGALEPKFWERFCRMVDREPWIELQYDFGPSAQRLRAELTTLFQSADRDTWVERARRHDTPITPVLSLDEVERDPHFQSRAMFLTQEHAQAGKVRGIAPPLKFSQTPCRISNPAARLGAHTRELIEQLNLDAHPIDALERLGILAT